MDRLCPSDVFAAEGATALLLHFRYHIVPCIDLGNLDRGFSTSLMRFADRSTAVFNAIIVLALRHLEVTRQLAGGLTAPQQLRLRLTTDINSRLATENESSKMIVQALLALETFTQLRPAEWASFRFPDISTESTLQASSEPLKTLVRLACRIGRLNLSSHRTRIVLYVQVFYVLIKIKTSLRHSSGVKSPGCFTCNGA